MNDCIIFHIILLLFNYIILYLACLNRKKRINFNHPFKLK